MHFELTHITVYDEIMINLSERSEQRLFLLRTDKNEWHVDLKKCLQIIIFIHKN